MKRSYLPAGGVNLFQGIKSKCREIERTTVVGVHFEPYIRYSVTGDIEAMAQAIKDAFAQAQIAYK